MESDVLERVVCISMDWLNVSEESLRGGVWFEKLESCDRSDLAFQRKQLLRLNMVVLFEKVYDWTHRVATMVYSYDKDSFEAVRRRSRSEVQEVAKRRRSPADTRCGAHRRTRPQRFLSPRDLLLEC